MEQKCSRLKLGYRFFFAFMMTKMTLSLIAYDYLAEKVTHSVISLTPENTCKHLKRNITEETVNLQVLQTKTFEEVLVASCYVSRVLYINRCGRFGGRNSLKKVISNIYPVSRDDCTKMYKSNIYNDPIFRHVKVKLDNGIGEFSGTAFGSFSNDGNCEGQDFIDEYGNEHERVYILLDAKIHARQTFADVSLSDNRINFEYGSPCNSIDEECHNDFLGQSYWINSPDDAYCLNDKLLIIFEGQATKITEYNLIDNTTEISFSIKEGTEARSFLLETTGKTRVCEVDGYKTNHPNLFIITSIDNYFRLKVEAKIPSEEHRFKHFSRRKNLKSIFHYWLTNKRHLQPDNV